MSDLKQCLDMAESEVRLLRVEISTIRAQRDAIAREAGRSREALSQCQKLIKSEWFISDCPTNESPRMEYDACESALTTPATDEWLSGKIAEAVGPWVEVANRREAQVAVLREAGNEIMVRAAFIGHPGERFYDRGDGVMVPDWREELSALESAMIQTAAIASRYKARVREEVLRELEDLAETDRNGNLVVQWCDIKQLADAAWGEAQG